MSAPTAAPPTSEKDGDSSIGALENKMEVSGQASNEQSVTMESLKNRNSELEEELKAAKLDAKETLLALLQMAEGVRVITKHMQKATYDMDDEEEESKSEELTEQLFSDSIVKETCLRGTVFGTDLLRLWDAAHHVRDYARMVSEESKLSVEDVIQAQTTARAASERAEKAEAALRELKVENTTLRRQLDKTGSERRVLLNEVKSLREHMAASRKTQMERLLQQHIEGALLLHEGQLKALVAQQQQLKHEEEEKQDEEELELVQAEDCQENEDCQANTIEEAKQGTDGSEKVDAIPAGSGEHTPQSDPMHEEEDQSDAQNSTLSDNTLKSDVTGASQEATEPTNIAEKPGEQAAPAKIPEDTPSEANPDASESSQKSSASGGFGGGASLLGFGSKFHATWARTKPKDKPTTVTEANAEKDTGKIGATVTITEANNKEDMGKNGAKRSEGHRFEAADGQSRKTETANKENKRMTANQQNQECSTPAKEEVADPESAKAPASTSYSPVKLFPSFGRASPVPPPQVKQQEDKPQSSRSVDSASSAESSSGPGVGTKVINFLFYPEKTPHYQQAPSRQPVETPSFPKKQHALLELDTKESHIEKDNTSVDETEPSTMATAASSCAASRARTLSGENNKPINDRKSASSPMRIIPGSVSWSEDAQSIESNLASPLVQRSPKDITSCGLGTAAENVELYKDLKVFSSLAIPSDDEIDDYHYYQHHYQEEQPQTTT